MEPWSFDASRRQITVGNHTVQLTGREAQAFQYLLVRRGTIVLREELETEVWGMVRGVRSETVPVTLRNIRGKLGPQWRHIVQVIRGSGYRILDHANDRTLPSFGTPFFPRPAEQEALHDLLQDGWQVITLVGPGGIGKTRLAVEVTESLEEPLVFVQVGSARTLDDIVDRICRVSGLANAGLRELSQALDHWRPVIVLDEAEGVIPAVNQVIDHLGRIRFVVTSRRELGRANEAVHSVDPLRGAEGRAFARASIRASRWSRDPPDDPTLDRLLVLVDGLPLGVEVAGSHPLHPRDVVEDLEAGSPTTGTDRLQVALAGSYDYLDAAHRQTLHALCVPEGAISVSAIQDWLGPEALEHAEELGRRSLLSREGRSWRVLRTMRRFVRGKREDWADQTEAFDIWLFDRAATFSELVWRDPELAIQMMWPLLDDLVDALRRTQRRDLSEVLWTLALIASLRGPLQLCGTAIQLTTTKAPNDPLVALFSVCSPEAVDAKALPGALSRAPNTVRFRVALLFVFSWLPTEVAIEQLLPVDPDDPLHTWLIHVAHLTATGDAGGLRALAAGQASGGLQATLTAIALAQTLTRNQSGTAERQWTQVVESTESSAMRNLHQLAVTGLADAQVEGNPERARAGYRAVATRSIRRGLGDSWAVARCGLWILLLDGSGESRPLLEHGSRSPHRRIRDLCLALLHVLDHRADRSVALRAPAGICGTLIDGTSLAELVSTLFEVEGLPLDRDPRLTAAWVEASDTAAIRVWKNAELRRRQ